MEGMQCWSRNESGLIGYPNMFDGLEGVCKYNTLFSN